ncbi:unnamed protein product [Cochlearia groenlandica]
MKYYATTMKIAMFLLLLITVQTMAEPFTDKTGQSQPDPSYAARVPSSPGPSANDVTTESMPEPFIDLTDEVTTEPGPPLPSPSFNDPENDFSYEILDAFSP